MNSEKNYVRGALSTPVPDAFGLNPQIDAGLITSGVNNIGLCNILYIFFIIERFCNYTHNFVTFEPSVTWYLLNKVSICVNKDRHVFHDL